MLQKNDCIKRYTTILIETMIMALKYFMDTQPGSVQVLLYGILKSLPTKNFYFLSILHPRYHLPAFVLVDDVPFRRLRDPSVLLLLWNLFPPRPRESLLGFAVLKSPRTFDSARWLDDSFSQNFSLHKKQFTLFL